MKKSIDWIIFSQVKRRHKHVEAYHSLYDVTNAVILNGYKHYDEKLQTFIKKMELLEAKLVEMREGVQEKQIREGVQKK